MALDVQVFDLLNGLMGYSPIVDALIIFCAGYVPYLLGAFFLLLVFLMQYPRKRVIMFWMAAVSIVIARFGVVELIHMLYQRPRPYLALATHHLLTENSWSFPSMHATVVFALATVVYCYDKMLGQWFFAVAALVGIARIAAGVHYPSDIIGGAAIGAAVAYLTVKYVGPRFERRMVH